MRPHTIATQFVEHEQATDKVTCYCHIESAVGKLLLTSDGTNLTGVYPALVYAPKSPAPHWKSDRSFFAGVIDQLEAYFQGRLRQFEVPLAPSGTALQQTVWKLMAQVSHGQTSTLSQLMAGLPKGLKKSAVSAAVLRNPLMIVVPCHRLVDDNGPDATPTPLGQWKARLRAHETGDLLSPGVRFCLSQDGFGLRKPPRVTTH
jgi:methylated-DNA-[protein]-cysteine S-methyltransferase